MIRTNQVPERTRDSRHPAIWRGLKTPSDLASLRPSWMDHSERPGVRLLLSPYGFIFGCRRKCGCLASHATGGKDGEVNSVASGSLDLVGRRFRPRWKKFSARLARSGFVPGPHCATSHSINSHACETAVKTPGLFRVAIISPCGSGLLRSPDGSHVLMVSCLYVSRSAGNTGAGDHGDRYRLEATSCLMRSPSKAKEPDAQPNDQRTKP